MNFNEKRNSRRLAEEEKGDTIPIENDTNGKHGEREGETFPTLPAREFGVGVVWRKGFERALLCARRALALCPALALHQVKYQRDEEEQENSATDGSASCHRCRAG